jgi:hypothetical protein
MGLDITLREYKGFNDNGYLYMVSVDEPTWNQDRVAIRKEINSNIKFTVLNSGKDLDWEEYYRPSDFKQAYEWSKTLSNSDRDYISNMLDILKKNDNYYLDFGH